MKRPKYKEAFIILMKNHNMWKDLTDADKKEIFIELNKVGFNYDIKDYK
jgi:hypothetical protein